MTTTFSLTVPHWLQHPAGQLRSMLLALAAAVLAAGPVSAGLAVAWSKGFSPNTIGPGSVSTLTFTLSNNSSAGVRGVSFMDSLPAGVVLASPANPTIDCAGILSAPDGGSTISLTESEVPANGSCTITVDVTGTAIGTHTNLTGDLTSDAGNSGPTTADLTILEELPGFSKSFSPASVGLGGRSTLTFTIDNSLNEGSRDNLTFADVLPAGLVVADPPNVINNCGGGTITAVPGSNSISLIQSFPLSASVGAFQSCTISVDVTAESVGRSINVSGELTSTLPQDFTPVSSGFASAVLDVVISPLVFLKTFIDDPVTPGANVLVEYTIVNRSREFELTDISFSDEFEAALSGLSTNILPASGWCGTGSQLTGSSQVLLTGGRLAPEGSCTFRLPLDVPASALPGSYPSRTSAITAVLNGNPVSGSPATDSLFVTVAPTLSKSFLENGSTPGGTVTMRFTITNNSPTSSASEITFVDELPPELADPFTPPEAEFCGPGSLAVVTPASQFDPARLTISGVELAPGANCVVDVLATIAPDANTGIVTNTTEPVQAMIDDTLVTGNAASASLSIVSAPRLSKTFLDNPILPGEVARLQYTLSYGAESVLPATDISFIDDLEAVLPGLIATNLPLSGICGPQSSVTGTSRVSFQGGVLPPGGTCTFVVEVLVPTEAAFGSVTNTTSAVSARVGGHIVMGPPATANLLVTGLTFTKEFPNSPVIPGEITSLRFTITNSGTVDATNIVFTDDLDAALPGLAGVQLPLNDICGRGSSLIGAPPSNSLLVFQGGSVKAGTSCSFELAVQIPASAPEGQYVNATSNLSAEFEGNALTLPAAAAVLEVSNRLLSLTKSFTPNPVEVGSATSLEFTLTNLHPTSSIDNISFTDVLPGGLWSTTGTVAGICGANSQISGITTLSFTGGSLGPGASCVFSLSVAVPFSIPTGPLSNTTSEVSGQLAGLAVRGDPGVATIVIEPPFRIREVKPLPSGSVSVEWWGLPGRTYCVEWSIDMENWTTVDPPILARSEITQWIDPGPMVTPGVLLEVPRRFYRIMLKGPE